MVTRFVLAFFQTLAAILAIIAFGAGMIWGMTVFSDYLQSSWGFSRARSVLLTLFTVASLFAGVIAGIQAAKGGAK